MIMKDVRNQAMANESHYPAALVSVVSCASCCCEPQARTQPLSKGGYIIVERGGGSDL